MRTNGGKSKAGIRATTKRPTITSSRALGKVQAKAATPPRTKAKAAPIRQQIKIQMPAAHRLPLSVDDDGEAVEITTRVHGRAGARTGEVDIYSDIGRWGVSADSFKSAIKNMGAVEKLVVNINSPGGDVFDGIAIYNTLLSLDAEVTVRVTGLAASAASVIAMAGDRLEMADNAFLMIHNAWTFATGDHRDMRQTADVLEKINSKLVATYAKRSGQDADEIRNMMDEETWLDSGDAIELGLADATFESGDNEANASVDVSRFQNVPPTLAKRMARTVAKPAKTAEPTAATPQLDFAAIINRLQMLTETMA